MIPDDPESENTEGKDTYWKLKWSDEFDGTALDTTKWDYQYGNGSVFGVAGWGNNEKQWYTDGTTDNVKVEDGSLVIIAKKDSAHGDGTTYSSGKLYTLGNDYFFDSENNEPLFSTKYGRVEAKMTLPAGKSAQEVTFTVPAGQTVQYGTVQFLTGTDATGVRLDNISMKRLTNLNVDYRNIKVYPLKNGSVTTETNISLRNISLCVANTPIMQAPDMKLSGIKRVGEDLVLPLTYAADTEEAYLAAEKTAVITAEDGSETTVTPVVKAVRNNKDITLSWNAVANAAGYDVYRAADGKNFVKAASVTATAYTDKALAVGSYSYKVVAKGSGFYKDSADSNVAATDITVVKVESVQLSATALTINKGKTAVLTAAVLL